MRKFLIASHGEFAKGILDSVRMIVGEKEHVHYLGVLPGDSQEEVEVRLNSIFKLEEKNEWIVLSDILGGSVTNVLLTYATNENIHLISGMNLPLVLEVLLSDDSIDSKEVIDKALTLGREGIMYVNQNIK